MSAQGGGLVRKIVGFSMVSVISAVLSLIVVPVSTYLYDQAVLGKINFFFTVVPIVYTCMCLGLDQGYVRFWPLCDDEERKRSLLTADLAICVTVLGIVSVFAFIFQSQLALWLFDDGSQPAALWLTTTVLSLVALRFVSLRYRMGNDVVHYTVYAGLASLIQKGLYILTSPFSRSYEAALVFVSTASILMAVIVVVSERGSFGRPRLGKERQFYTKEARFSAPLLAAAVLTLLSNYTPQFVIRSAVGYEGVSIYTAALTVSLAIQLVQSGFNTFWAPFVYENYDTRQGAIQDMHEAIVTVSTIVCMVLALFSDLIFLLLKASYVEGAALVPFLMLGPMCYTIGETVGVGINLRMKSGISMLITLAGLTVNVVLCIVLVNAFGLKGAAVAVGISGLAVLALKTVIGERFYRSIRTRAFMTKAIVLYLIVCFASVTLVDQPLVRYALTIVCLVLFVLSVGTSYVLGLVGKVKRAVFKR